MINKPRTFVLVHGADNTAEVWNKVTPLLNAEGSKVFCPTLTPISLASLETNICEVVSLFEEEDIRDCVLVGHSYAAMVITGVFDRLSERISSLVYIDSAIPSNGKSLVDILKESYGDDLVSVGLGDVGGAAIDKLWFNEARFRGVPKTYIQCEKSEFAKATRKSLKYSEDHAEESKWTCERINTTHKVMLTEPVKLSEILIGQ